MVIYLKIWFFFRIFGYRRLFYARLLMSYHYNAWLIRWRFAPFALSFLLTCLNNWYSWCYRRWRSDYWHWNFNLYLFRYYALTFGRQTPFYIFLAIIWVIIKELIIFQKSGFNLPHSKFSLPFSLIHLFFWTLSFLLSFLLLYFIFCYMFFCFLIFIFIRFLRRWWSRSSFLFIFYLLFLSTSLSWTAFILFRFLLIFVLLSFLIALYIPYIPIRHARTIWNWSFLFITISLFIFILLLLLLFLRQWSAPFAFIELHIY